MIPSYILYPLFVLFVVASIAISAKTIRALPRNRQRYHRLNFWVTMPFGGYLIYWCVTALPAPEVVEIMCGLMGVTLIGSSAYQAFRRQTKAEVDYSYQADPNHCGQCGYDLTGNISGICPECGWKLPEQAGPVESLDWFRFWKKWQIDYMVKWRTRLAAMTVGALLTTATAVYLPVKLARLFSPEMLDILNLWFIIFMAAALVPIVASPLVFWIQVIRIAAYGYRQRETISRCP